MNKNSLILNFIFGRNRTLKNSNYYYDNMLNNYHMYLCNLENHPTTTMIAKREVFHPLKIFKKKLSTDSHVEKRVERIMKERYPKTLEIREFLVKCNCFRLDRVTPASEHEWVKKAIILAKKFKP